MVDFEKRTPSQLLFVPPSFMRYACRETKLFTDPRRHGKKLVGKARRERWRFRAGDYRMRFDIEGGALLFYRVRHRREIYE